MKIAYRQRQAIINSFGNDVIKLIQGKDDPMQYESVERWERQCFNTPRDNELIMTAINEITDGYGVESIEGDEYIDNYHRYCRASYINMGDTYATTLVLDHENNTIHLIVMNMISI